jgi:hypothetical protein
MNQHGKKNRTKHEEDEGELNIYTKKKLLSFPTKVNNNNNKKKTKHLECNCWVCKILDSSSTVTNVTATSTKRYEPYNLVSETGDSIFYDPLLSNLNDDDILNRQQIYIAEDKIREIVQQDKNKLTKYFNGVNFNKIEY